MTSEQSHFSYRKLALHGLRNNRQTYLPYTVAATVTVMIYYILQSLSLDPTMDSILGGRIVAEFMAMGSVVIAVFSIIFLFYINNFLMKRRKKELGLYHILGMEKQHICCITAIELFFVGMVSILSGIFLGICCNKFMYLLIVKLLHGTVSFGFYISAKAVCRTILFFSIAFGLTFSGTVWQICTSNPITLLRSEQTGEQEPKAKKGIAILGLFCLGAGYAVALSLQQPIEAMIPLLIAVLLVIIGTYCTFTAGSIALLKLLKSKKDYYYTPAHFVSVSGLLYRMKQNAIGLANICILSTIVLVLLSSTLALMLGIEENIDRRNPYDISFYALDSTPQQNDQWLQITEDILHQQTTITGLDSYVYLEYTAQQTNNQLELATKYSAADSADTKALLLIPGSSYLAAEPKGQPPVPGQLLLYDSSQAYRYDTLQLEAQTYTVRTLDTPFVHNSMADYNRTGNYYLVLSDYDFQQFCQSHNQQPEFYCGITLSASPQQQLEIAQSLQQALEAQGLYGRVESRSGMAAELRGMYGGLLFLGGFLSIIFFLATVLIIYYKQISEGYEDKKRYQILQNVGMSQQEVKAAITSQIRIVFFLPLLMAALHMLVCLPALYKILTILGLVNLQLLLGSTIGCFSLFALLYLFVYRLTSRAYYQIVKYTK